MMKRLIYAAILVLLLPAMALAQNLVHHEVGAGVTWLNTGGDEQLDLGDGTLGVAGAIGCGSYHDWGDGSSGVRTTTYMIELVIDGFNSTPEVGERIDLYVSQGQTNSLFSGDLALQDTTDLAASISSNALPNLQFVGSGLAESTTAADNIIRYFEYVFVPARYWAPCVHNVQDGADATDNLLTTSDAHSVTVYPVYFEVQP